VQDEAFSLPILLPLSSWAIKRPTLQEWIYKQLCSHYNVPRQVSRQWVQDEQILPLLDGLDEMEEAARPACIKAINSYHNEHIRPLVVCSRIEEYETASESGRLCLQSAVVVQPLAYKQVHPLLVQAGEPLAALLSEYEDNAELQELATTPLMLNILMRTYRGMTVKKLPRKKAALQWQIWTNYVECVVELRENAAQYSQQQTLAWLSRLAQHMHKNYKTTFHPTQLQLDWLPKKQRVFCRWGIKLFSGLLLGSLSGLFLGLGIGLFSGQPSGSLQPHLFLEKRKRERRFLSCLNVTSCTIGNRQRSALNVLS
jgi:hypothetical protein